jgi:hypothetical protein
MNSPAPNTLIPWDIAAIGGPKRCADQGSEPDPNVILVCPELHMIV